LSHIKVQRRVRPHYSEMSPSLAAKRLVAVIEDDAAVLSSIDFSLTAQGYDVCGFESAAPALESPKIMVADCLVIDYALPDMNGMALLAALRRRGLSIPAIVIASNPTARCRSEVETAGVPLIEKPIMSEALNELLHETLKRADQY